MHAGRVLSAIRCLVYPIRVGVPVVLDPAIGCPVPSECMAQRMLPRRVQIVRKSDLSGISGTGVVAFGVEFPDGRCVTRWRGQTSGVSQTCIWDSIIDIEEIHGHNGSTRIEYID